LMSFDSVGLALAALSSYFLGALPFSAWIARWRGVDIRHLGSGNPGATNVARTLGLSAGALALLLDLGKGAAAAALVGVFHAPLAVAGFAVLGHNWSVFLRFGGGKGVATSLGVLFVVSLPAALATVGVWFVLVALTRKVSIGSVISMGFAPAFLWWVKADPTLVGLFVALAALSLFLHRANLRRLLKGQELSLSAKR